MAEILVFCRIKRGQPTRNSLEGLGAGSKLAAVLNAPVGAIVTFQPGEEDALNALIAYGAQHVYAVRFNSQEGFYPEYGLHAAETVCRTVKPRIVLFAADTDGREIGPKLAHRLNAGIVSECVELEADGETDGIHGLKPVYGGKAVARFAARQVQVFTLREHAFGALERDDSRQGEISTIESTMPEGALRIREIALDRKSVV